MARDIQRVPGWRCNGSGGQHAGEGETPLEERSKKERKDLGQGASRRLGQTTGTPHPPLAPLKQNCHAYATIPSIQRVVGLLRGLPLVA